MFEWYKRYGSPDMHKTWSTLERLRHFAETERSWLLRLKDSGLVNTDDISLDMNYLHSIILLHNDAPQRLLQLYKDAEKEHHGHEMIAFLNMDIAGVDDLKWIHFGLTSSDIMDTALGLQVNKSSFIVEEKIKTLIHKLSEIYVDNKDLLTYGRTHGQAASTLPFGNKFRRYMYQLQLYIPLFHPDVNPFYKDSGSVGVNPTGCGKTLSFECSQVVSRNMIASQLHRLPIIAGILEQIAKEVRNLSREEICELQEGDSIDREESSAIPLKFNPRSSENVCGLARVVRSNYAVLLENIALEHERDLTNSSSERVVISTMFILLDEMLDSMIKVMSNLKIHKPKVCGNWLKHKNQSELMYLFLILDGKTRAEARSTASIKNHKAYKDTIKRPGFAAFTSQYHEYITGDLDNDWMKKFKRQLDEVKDYE